MQSVEKTFQLTRADKDLLSKPEYDVQVGCMTENMSTAYFYLCGMFVCMV